MRFWGGGGLIRRTVVAGVVLALVIGVAFMVVLLTIADLRDSAAQARHSDQVLAAAKEAKDAGATRFCMGAAWREVKEGPQFDRVLDMVRGVKGLGLEACVTLGMLNEGQAEKLKQAGLDAYNHNLDTSRENYKSIISTRSLPSCRTRPVATRPKTPSARRGSRAKL